MEERTKTRLSKFLSLVLRHDPGTVGITLDSQGWVDVGVLLKQCQAHGRMISRAELEEVVATSPKQRFALSEDGLRIRANQGHSVAVELGYEPRTPPDVLYHGTVERFLGSIRERGLEKMSRHHVHLSPDEATATTVGGRRGRPLVLRIDAARMYRDGYVFYLSENGVWLTERVPPEYIGFPEEG